MRFVASVLTLAVLLGSALLGCANADPQDAARKRKSSPRSAEKRNDNSSSTPSDVSFIAVTINDSGVSPNALVFETKADNLNKVKVTNESKTTQTFRIKFSQQEVGLKEPLAPGKTGEFEFVVPAGESMGGFSTGEGKEGFRGRVIVNTEAVGG